VIDGTIEQLGSDYLLEPSSIEVVCEEQHASQRLARRKGTKSVPKIQSLN
jgi:hypothetical protein